MIDLFPFNTFRVHAQALGLIEINTPEDLLKLKSPVLFLGSGANILFAKDFSGLVAKNNLKGRKIISETDQEIIIELASGENWNDFVLWAAGLGYSGMENMADIPGTVGAAVVGNIAAYGQNQEDIFVSLTAVDLTTHQDKQFGKDECHFAYRHSGFKDDLTNYFITSVQYKLSKVLHLETSYRSRYESLSEELAGITQLTPLDVAQAVTKLRRKKLPDWTKVGTAGSFFKNPVITRDQYTQLVEKLPGLQWYPVEKLQYSQIDSAPLPDKVKIPAGRLLDELGWKGKRIGDVGTHTNHALTIVNYGQATGQEIYDFAMAMQADVQKNFDITLEPEVLII